MRIDDANRLPAALGSPSASARSEKTADKASAEKTSPDQTKLSALASSLAAADPDRLDKLRQQIESGAYHPNAGAIADALIDEHFNSPGKPGQ
jgi:flagellar biosynthesis anti-sigma factor FlgM